MATLREQAKVIQNQAARILVHPLVPHETRAIVANSAALMAQLAERIERIERDERIERQEIALATSNANQAQLAERIERIERERLEEANR